MVPGSARPQSEAHEQPRHCGQLVGGLLVSADVAGTGWRLIFLVNVPVGLVGLVLAARLLPVSRSTDPARADLRGTALLGAAVLCLLVPLMVGHTLGWPVWLWVMLAAAPVAAIAFVRTERRVERAGGVARVPPSLLRLPGMRLGLGLAVPFFVGFGGFMFVFAVMLQRGLGFGALAAGLASLPMMLGFLVASVYTARQVARYGRWVLTVGALVQGAGLAMLVAVVLADWPHLGVAALAPGYSRGRRPTIVRGPRRGWRGGLGRSRSLRPPASPRPAPATGFRRCRRDGSRAAGP